ncbi:MAG TPA: metallophosphoesterase family protein [Candidatus Sulfopaludibacter sp.]|nr:metallophosphoesterase family protein [Candidatus Sulfopaludibacter sp.]
MARVGLISDTHGLLRPRAVEALAGSDLIIHAGDVGDPAILEALRRIAPLTAVRGNIDKAPWARTLPETAVVEGIYVLHNLRELDLDPAAGGFRAVVSGHSHKPGSFRKNGVLYINPGSAGPRRFRLPVTVARLDTRAWTVEFMEVE